MIKIFAALIIFCSLTALATSFVGAPVTGTAGASAMVLAQNIKRGYLLVQNTGSTSIIVKFGSTISSSNEGVLVPGGGSYEPILAPANSVWLKASSGSPTYVVIQGNN